MGGRGGDMEQQGPQGSGREERQGSPVVVRTRDANGGLVVR